MSKLKPFDLQKALAGKPVVTRNGDQVIKIVHLPEVADGAYKVVAIIAGRNTPTFHFEDGKIRRDLDGLDLFMAPEKKTLHYISRPHDIDGAKGPIRDVSHMWESEELLRQNTGDWWFGEGHIIHTIEIEL